MRGALDAKGQVVALDYDARAADFNHVGYNEHDTVLIAQLIGQRKAQPARGRASFPSDKYAIPNRRMAGSVVPMPLAWETPVRMGNLRDPDGPQVTFASESFIDELAAAAKADPVAFRLALLERGTDDDAGFKRARSIACLKAAAEKFGWEPRPSPNRRAQGDVAIGRGVAYAYRSETVAVEMVEVEVNRRTGRVWVKRIACAHDCGLVINPEALTRTLEGGLLHSVSRALFEEARFDEAKMLSVDWVSSPTLTHADVPERIDIVQVNGDPNPNRPDLPHYGAGETVCKPMMAAVANAVFDATGVRMRRVPFTATQSARGAESLTVAPHTAVARIMSERPAALRLALIATVVAAGYYVGAQIGLALTFPPATTSVLWPPNAILTAALLMVPPRLWWVCLAGALPVHILLEIDAGFSAQLVALLFVTNCSEALLAAIAVRVLSDAPTRFDSFRRVAAFVAGAGLLAPIVSSFADAAVVDLVRGENYWDVWRVRVFSNVLTELSVAPAIILGWQAARSLVARPSARTIGGRADRVCHRAAGARHARVRASRRSRRLAWIAADADRPASPRVWLGGDALRSWRRERGAARLRHCRQLRDRRRPAAVRHADAGRQPDRRPDDSGRRRDSLDVAGRTARRPATGDGEARRAFAIRGAVIQHCRLVPSPHRRCGGPPKLADPRVRILRRRLRRPPAVGRWRR